MPSSAQRVIADLARVLGALGVRWYVFGAQATIAYGHARLTADVDVTVELGTRSTQALLDALDAQGIVARFAFDAAFVERTRVLPLVHSPTTMDVDVVLAGPGPEETFLDQVVHLDIGGTAVPFASPTDLVVMKVLAGRPKDLEDVIGLLRARPASLDVAAARAALSQLEAALDQSDLVPALDAAIAKAARGHGT